MVHKNLVTLVVSSNTIILDPFGQNISFNALRIGMIVDAANRFLYMGNANDINSLPDTAKRRLR